MVHLGAHFLGTGRSRYLFLAHPLLELLQPAQNARFFGFCCVAVAGVVGIEWAGLHAGFGLTCFVAAISQDAHAAHHHAIFKGAAFTQASLSVYPAGGGHAGGGLQCGFYQALPNGVKALLRRKGFVAALLGRCWQRCAQSHAHAQAQADARAQAHLHTPNQASTHDYRPFRASWLMYKTRKS